MKNMFNIYYINNEKASEISMLFDNQIVEKITRIKNTELALAGDVDATTGAASKIPVIGQYLPSVDLNGNLSHNRSNRVEDTVKVVSSKSTILKPIYEKAKEVRRLDDSKVGNLVKIKDVWCVLHIREGSFNFCCHQFIFIIWSFIFIFVLICNDISSLL